jgi:hypothetical protein
MCFTSYTTPAIYLNQKSRGIFFNHLRMVFMQKLPTILHNSCSRFSGECLVFKGNLLPRDDAHLTMNGQQLALIKIVGCEHRDIVDKEFQVELNVTLRLVSNAVPHLIYDIVPVDLYTMLSSVYLHSTSIDRHDIKIKINELTTNNALNRNQVTKYVIATPASQQDVPPSIGISPPAGHIQHASTSGVFGVGRGNVNDSDGRTHLQPVRFDKGLLTLQTQF